MRARDSVTQRTIWRFFPGFIALGMAVVVAVNFTLIYSALHTFPGKAGGDGFDLSNDYNNILDRAAREAATGWTMRLEVDAAGHPVLALKDRAGAGLAGASIVATAERPLGERDTTAVTFTEAAPGRYVSDAVLDRPGQWEVQLTASAGGHAFSATRRLVVR